MLTYKPLMLCLVLTLVGVSACSRGDLPVPMAPVVNGWSESASKQGPYVVQAGDTLYSIAWTYGIDYHAIIRDNHLQAPYLLKTGQTLYLTTPPAKPVQAATPRPVTSTKHAVKQETQATHRTTAKATATSAVTSHTSAWLWPVSGTVVQTYNANNAGIDIRTSPNARIHAARAGQVVYAGHGIPNYGNLIIIKHGTEYLTAYAYNAKNLVKEGDNVKAGQVIATVQGTATKPNVLHFDS